MQFPELRTKLDYALFFTRLGLKVIPVNYVYQDDGITKCSCWNGANCDSKGKHPALNSYKDFDFTTLTKEKMVEWFSEDGEYHNHNLGAFTGHKAGYVVIDTDIRSDECGETNLINLANQHGSLPETLTIKTGTGGFHRYYLHPENTQPVKSSSGEIAKKVDVRGFNGMAVLPPSIHENGQAYELVSKTFNLADLPAWLIGIINKENAPPKSVAPEKQPLPQSKNNLIPEGKRNNYLIKIAGQLRNKGLSKDQIYAELVKEYHQSCEQTPAISNQKLMKMAKWISKKAMKKNNVKLNQILLTDAGNAQLFQIKYSDDVRYCRTVKSWLYFDGKKWTLDTMGHITQYALTTIIEARVELMKQSKEPKEIEKIDQYYTSCTNKNKLDSMIDLASRIPALHININLFDNHKFKINLNNGTYDLLEDRFYAHTKQDFFSINSPVDFNPYAQCDLFHQFLSTTFSHNQDLIQFIQKALGMCLSGDITEQAMFILYGTGANGKTTLLETISHILGDYASAANFKTFIETKNDNVRNDLARLRDKRMVTAVEANSKAKLDEALIKSVTGGDKIVARFLYKEEFEYYPQFKLFLATNHKPIIGASDYGIIRRIRFVPFNHRYTGDQVDRTIGDKLKLEASGILNWLLEGLRIWRREGLGYPKVIKEATENYLSSIDIIGNFINDCCVLNIDDLKLTSSVPNISELKGARFKSKCEANLLYNVYSQWAELNGVIKMGSPSLKYTFEERGIHQKRFSSGNYYIGIELQKNVFDKFKNKQNNDDNNNFNQGKGYKNEQNLNNYQEHNLSLEKEDNSFGEV